VVTIWRISCNEYFEYRIHLNLKLDQLVALLHQLHVFAIYNVLLLFQEAVNTFQVRLLAQFEIAWLVIGRIVFQNGVKDNVVAVSMSVSFDLIIEEFFAVQAYAEVLLF